MTRIASPHPCRRGEPEQEHLTRERFTPSSRRGTNLRPCPICGKQDAKDVGGGESRPTLYRCWRCRAVYWGNTWGSKQVSEHYCGYYKVEEIEYDPLTEKRYHAILGRLEQLRSVGRLLDVGCGTGHFLAVAEARGWQAVGLEVSESALDFLKRVRAEGGFKFSVVKGDLVQSGFSPESFDAVALFEVIEHLPDPLASLKEIYRLLAGGGIVYMTTPNFDSLSRYLLGCRWRAIVEEHLVLFNVRTLRACLEAVGFHALTIKTKNVDIMEILFKWRQHGQMEKPVNPFSATRAFRHTIEGSPWLRRLKTGANTVLRLSHLGDTVEALAVKQHKV